MFGCCSQHGGRARLGLLLSGATVNATKLQPAEDLPGLKAINSPRISPWMLKAYPRSHFQGMVGWELRLTDTLRIALGPKTTFAPSSCVCTKLQNWKHNHQAELPTPEREEIRPTQENLSFHHDSHAMLLPSHLETELEQP